MAALVCADEHTHTSCLTKRRWNSRETSYALKKFTRWSVKDNLLVSVLYGNDKGDVFTDRLNRCACARFKHSSQQKSRTLVRDVEGLP